MNVLTISQTGWRCEGGITDLESGKLYIDVYIDKISQNFDHFQTGWSIWYLMKLSVKWLTLILDINWPPDDRPSVLESHEF